MGKILRKKAQSVSHGSSQTKLFSICQSFSSQAIHDLSNTNNNDLNDEKTHFGYESINKSEKESRVKEVFSKVAESYDVMNDLMSVGIHRYWKHELCSMTALENIATMIRQQQQQKQQQLEQEQS